MHLAKPMPQSRVLMNTISVTELYRAERKGSIRYKLHNIISARPLNSIRKESSTNHSSDVQSNVLFTSLSSVPFQKQAAHAQGVKDHYVYICRGDDARLPPNRSPYRFRRPKRVNLSAAYARRPAASMATFKDERMPTFKTWQPTDDDSDSTQSGSTRTSYATTRSAQSCPATFTNYKKDKKNKKATAKPTAKARAGMTSSGEKPNFQISHNHWKQGWQNEDSHSSKGWGDGRGHHKGKSSATYSGGKKGRYHPRTQVMLPAVARGISHTQKETQMAHGATKKATQPKENQKALGSAKVTPPPTGTSTSTRDVQPQHSSDAKTHRPQTSNCRTGAVIARSAIFVPLRKPIPETKRKVRD